MNLPFEASLDRLVQWFARLETGVVIILVAFVTTFGLIQILLRNVFATGLMWGDTFLRHAVLWICMLGAARAVAEDKHIHIDLLLQIVPAKLALVLRIIANLLPVIISVIMLYCSWEFVQNERSGENMAFGSFPSWWLQLIFPFTFLVMTLRFAARLVAPSTHHPEGPEA